MASQNPSKRDRFRRALSDPGDRGRLLKEMERSEGSFRLVGWISGYAVR